MKKSRMRKHSAGSVTFDVINIILVTLVACIMVYPFINVVAVSLSSYNAYLSNPLMIIPREVSFTAFRYVFMNKMIINGYANTVFITVTGTLLGLLLTVMMSYALSKKDLPGRGFFMTYVIFTSLFSGGIIPGFYLMKSIGLIDSLWALILPTMLASFNVVLMKNFFEGLPANLEEAARIDGAGEIKILTDVILPISKPIIATIALFIAVSYWNSYFSAILYIRSQSKWTLQLVMREIISSAETTALTAGSNMAEYGNLPTQSLKYATLVVAILPILCVYPFLQKYFAEGIMVGAIKG